jgi:hypothetical protein
MSIIRCRKNFNKVEQLLENINSKFEEEDFKLKTINHNSGATILYEKNHEQTKVKTNRYKILTGLASR